MYHDKRFLTKPPVFPCEVTPGRRDLLSCRTTLLEPANNTMSIITLEPMTQPQFADFMEAILPAYVTERAAADHVTPDAAERFARDQHARLLTDGPLTPGHHFLRIVAASGHQTVGGVWFWIDDDNKQAFLYNITVYAQHRRQGFATAALAFVEEQARAAGCATLGLNVFATNEAAMALYRKLGFCAVTSYWNKPLRESRL